MQDNTELQSIEAVVARQLLEVNPITELGMLVGVGILVFLGLPHVPGPRLFGWVGVVVFLILLRRLITMRFHRGAVASHQTLVQLRVNAFLIGAAWGCGALLMSRWLVSVDLAQAMTLFLLVGVVGAVRFHADSRAFLLFALPLVSLVMLGALEQETTHEQLVTIATAGVFCGVMWPLMGQLRRRWMETVDIARRLAWNEAELRRGAEASAQLAAIVQSSDDSIVSVDVRGTVRTFNATAERFFRVPAHEAIGRFIGDLLPKTSLSDVGAQMRKVLGGESLRDIEERMPDEHGDDRHLSLTLAPMFDAEGHVTGVAAIARDITVRLRAESAAREAARVAAASAEQASRLKSQFLATMSHEMRTPLHGILGTQQLLLASPLSAEQRHWVELMRGTATSLLGLINDILDLSKIESGRFDLQPAPVDLRAMLRDALSLLRIQANEAGLSLTISVASDVPRRVVLDADRLRQVLVNLVGNAVKFTHKGGVTLHVLAEAASQGLVTLHFAVTDTGIGIPADKLGLLFQDFQQLDSSPTRRYGGSGLGLAISRRIVALMGGALLVESVPGQGSTFSFGIRVPEAASVPGGRPPLASSPAPAETATADARPRRRVLIAEDNEVNMMVAASMLQQRGHSICQARDGSEAVDAASRERFDVILMDLEMPLLSGFEALRRIRELPAPGPGRVLALTAHAGQEDRLRCLEAGFDGFLSKPFVAADLFAAVEAAPALEPALAGVSP